MIQGSLVSGPWSKATRGNETIHTLSNGDLTLEFTNKGGVLRQATLNQFKTYRGDELRLFDSLGSRMHYALVTDQSLVRSDQC
ncbi:MAG: hypothetical protein ACKO17_02360, partial [Bacteroidota bacterium]